MDAVDKKIIVAELAVKNTTTICMNRISLLRAGYSTRSFEHWVKELESCRRELCEVQRLLMYIHNLKQQLQEDKV